ncbi:MAG TPA: hypothetical protein PLH02_01315 [Bacillota bacterium]|nr:hypothetical protein [Bacillota bacterium]HPF42056.1 hypothetical protein [Bacillota bacterium]HPJ85779.1 hypothetical protein [Bacillota bacterium]HPQ61504.1 hypothetical protein [Bacillota bacterium]HRX91763.1 hypothetical protein [Candidatus Izemoplasmatales bacterium]
MKNKIVYLLLYLIFAIIGWFGTIINLIMAIKGDSSGTVITFTIVFALMAILVTAAFIKRLIRLLIDIKINKENK